MINFDSNAYRGRLAPSPTGLLHVGHARTFWTAAQRASEHNGILVLRNEDLDSQRCRPEFVRAMIEDLRWLGISWTEGPNCGGPFGPYIQSERRQHYLAAWNVLRRGQFICSCTWVSSAGHGSNMNFPSHLAVIGFLAGCIGLFIAVASVLIF